MIDHVFENGKEILEIAYNIPHFWRRERNLQKLHMIDNVFEERKEISKIVCDSPHFWRREKF